MKTSRILYPLVALVCAICAHAASAAVVLAQGFDDVDALDGWLLVNRSEPPGMSWFQGNPGVFAAQSGPADSYIGANFESAQGDSGGVDNWLITPLLALAGPTQLLFYTRGAATPGFHDMLEVRFGQGDTADPATFAQILVSVGAGGYPDSWQRFVVGVNVVGGGRFAFRYTGPAAAADYIGIDSVVITSVPEPGAYALFGAGLALLLWRRQGRRRAAAAALALAALGIAPAAGAGEPQSMVVVRDAASGRLRAPTAAEFKVLQESAPSGAATRSRTDAPAQIELRADGTRRVHLGDRATVYTTSGRDAADASHQQCAAAPEAGAALDHATTHAEEHRHEAD
ncbi:hypothetical protein ACFDR9_002505 [Janthinobacterium sp. CG_23.3]|uniref:choice-of-anchor J domain-containing protein n=1 Tax=Janthinobacterium sp. CG_23.3 TaxID=3349634 RepID=UPI0038D4B099